MNEEQTKILLKKSALKTTEQFTDNLMEQLTAKSANDVQTNFYSIRRVVSALAVLVVILSILLYTTDFKIVSEIKLIGNAYHTKFFVVFLFSVLLGVNYILKLEHTSKTHFYK